MGVINDGHYYYHNYTMNIFKHPLLKSELAFVRYVIIMLVLGFLDLVMCLLPYLVGTAAGLTLLLFLASVSWIWTVGLLGTAALGVLAWGLRPSFEFEYDKANPDDFESESR